MPLAESAANDSLDALYGSGTPATLYFAAFTSAPNADGTGGTEVSGGSYARKAMTNNATNFPAASGGEKSNGVAIPFVAASASWGEVTHIVVFDSLSGGNRFDWGELENSRSITTPGDQLSLAIGDFVVKYE
jgi:hypothetical protein